MNLDINTLFLVTIYVEAILGLLLLFVWVQNVSICAVAWWGFAHLLRALSIMLFGMYGTAPGIVTIDIANVILFISFAATWIGARVFEGRNPSPTGIVAGAALWLLAYRLPIFADDANARFLLASGIITIYMWLASWEFWRGRSEPLVSRWPTIFMLFAHGALFVLRTPLVTVLPWSAAGQQMQTSVWLSVLSFEALLFTIAIAFMLLAMAKERTEYLHRIAALVDPLTGIANRRAFMTGADELVLRAAADGKSAAVVLMDLDHFKSINDRFGHATGDEVLQIFAKIVRETIAAGDVVGRLGGEEFAMVLANASREKALVTAERVRTAFAEAAASANDHQVQATVSMGVMMTEDAPADLSALLAQADHALYFAKERGRNRVEVASLELVNARGEMRGARVMPGMAAQGAASPAA